MITRTIKELTHNQKVVFPFLYGILALGVIYLMSSGGMGVSVDSERYLITANNLRNLEFETAFKIAFPHSPIFYPCTIALVQILGLAEGIGAARIVSILSFVVSAIVVFLLGLQIQGKLTAHMGSLSWLVFAPLIYAFSYCWSETVYIMLSLLFFLMLMLFLKAPKGKENRYLVICSICAGLGFITRFMGFSLIITGILVIFFLSKPDRISKKIKDISIFGLVACLPMLINLIVSFLFFNLPTRETAPAVLSLFGQIGNFFITLYGDFLSFNLTFDHYMFFHPPIYERSFFESHLLWIDAVILFCWLMLMVAFIKLLLSSASFRHSLCPQIGPAVYCFFYSLFLIVVTSRIAVDPIGSRFVMPLYPFIIILIFSGIFHACQGITQRKRRLVYLGLAILGTLLFWRIQLVSTTNIYKGISSGSFPAMEQPGNRNRTSLKYLKKNLTPANIVLSNIPDKLYFIWPRDNLYWSVSRTGFLLRQNSDPFVDSLVYVLLCTNDRDINPVMVETEGKVPSLNPIHFLSEQEQYRFVEDYLRNIKVTYQKVEFGHDYVYKLSFNK